MTEPTEPSHPSLNPPLRPLRVLALDLPQLSDADLPGGTIIRSDLAALDAALLDRVRPDQVLLPLFAPRHDASMVIERLQQIGYSGRITVIASALPHPRMVEAELRALGPGNRLTLLAP